MTSKEEILTTLAKNAEAVVIGTVMVLAIAGAICLACGVGFGWVLVILAMFVGCAATFLALEYRKWVKTIDAQQAEVSSRPLKKNEFFLDLTPEQYSEFLKNGYIVLPNGDAVISERYKKSGKMKHIKLEDYTCLNGSIRTPENEWYDGTRILDYEEKYGKNYGIPVPEGKDGNKRK